MPTIQQLPLTASVDAADEVPISQSGTTNAVSVGTLLSSMQPAISAPTGMLLGRNSVGPGGPEAVNVSVGLALQEGSLVATGGDHATYPVSTSPSGTDQVVVASSGTPRLIALATLQSWLGTQGGSGLDIASYPPTAALSSSDLIPVSQNGTIAAISYSNFIAGETIDEAAPALAAADTDTLWVSQGTSTLLRQTFAAIWNWVAQKLPTYKLPVVELSVNTTLDGTVHNGRLLVCSQPVTLAPAFLNMGSGFACEVLNLSAGAVVFGSGVVTSTGQASLASNQAALLRGVTYSGGSVVFASIVSGAAPAASPSTLPGQVSNLTGTTTTSNSIGLTWSPPAAGGTPSGYIVQYRVTGTTPWLTAAGMNLTTSLTVTGLSPSTEYDIIVTAANSAGSGPPSAMLTVSTSAPPGAVTAITWNLFPSASYSAGTGSIGVNVHVSPSTSAVQFGLSSSPSVPPTSWTAASYVNTDLWGAYLATPASRGTYYVWCEGTDGSAPTVCTSSFTVS